MTIHARARVGSDGILSLNLPLGVAEADREVVVTVQPAPPSGAGMNSEQWQEFIRSTAGRWEGEPLVRPEQGEYETRDERQGRKHRVGR